MLSEPKIDKKTYTTLAYVGTATTNALILENTSSSPMEVLRAGGSNAPANATKHVYSNGDPGSVIYTWNDPVNALSLSEANSDEIATFNSLIASESLVGWIYTSSSANPNVQRLVLLPGEKLAENGTVFTVGTRLAFIYRTLTHIEVV